MAKALLEKYNADVNALDNMKGVSVLMSVVLLTLVETPLFAAAGNENHPEVMWRWSNC